MVSGTGLRNGGLFPLLSGLPVRLKVVFVGPSLSVAVTVTEVVPLNPPAAGVNWITRFGLLLSTVALVMVIDGVGFVPSRGAAFIALKTSNPPVRMPRTV